MPTTLPRVPVTFQRPTYETLVRLAKSEQMSVSGLASRLIETALELSEDLVLCRVAKERLQSFRRDDALSTEEFLRWNARRRKRTS